MNMLDPYRFTLVVDERDAPRIRETCHARQLFSERFYSAVRLLMCATYYSAVRVSGEQSTDYSAVRVSGDWSSDYSVVRTFAVLWFECVPTCMANGSRS